MIKELLEQIQKTNPDMTIEKLISEIRYSDYLKRLFTVSFLFQNVSIKIIVKYNLLFTSQNVAIKYNY